MSSLRSLVSMIADINAQSAITDINEKSPINHHAPARAADPGGGLRGASGVGGCDELPMISYSHSQGDCGYRRATTYLDDTDIGDPSLCFNEPSLI